MKKIMFLMSSADKAIQIFIADTFLKRFLGLMGKTDSGYGMLITPCNSIHTCFMRYDLDILFLDKENRIVEIVKGIKPWRMTKIIKAAHSVLEFPSSLKVSLNYSTGMKLKLQPAADNLR